MTLLIRRERPSDIAAIHAVNRAAFPTDDEARLVDAIRVNGHATVSLVAEVDGEIVGHILFSPMTFEAPSVATDLLGLAPMAVVPARQNAGIGSRLVVAGLDACRDAGCSAVFVLGHHEYYPRFGFVPASLFGIRSRYDVPDEVFMAMELVPDALGGMAGCVVRYGTEFDAL